MMLRSDDDIRDAIDEILGVQYGLSGWEVKFIESVAAQWEDSGSISEKQLAKLEEICAALGQ